MKWAAVTSERYLRAQTGIAPQTAMTVYDEDVYNVITPLPTLLFISSTSIHSFIYLLSHLFILPSSPMWFSASLYNEISGTGNAHSPFGYLRIRLEIRMVIANTDLSRFAPCAATSIRARLWIVKLIGKSGDTLYLSASGVSQNGTCTCVSTSVSEVQTTSCRFYLGNSNNVWKEFNVNF